MILLKNLIFETEAYDRKKRRFALNVYNKVNEYIKKKGTDAFRSVGGLGSDKVKISSEDIDTLSEDLDFTLFFEPKEGRGPRGEFKRSHEYMGMKQSPKITLYVDVDEYGKYGWERFIETFKDKREAFIHEFTHYMDKDRIPPPSEIGYTKGFHKDYFNDPKELNAYYQQAVGELTAKIKNNPQSFKEKWNEWDFVRFKDWFFENIVDKNFKKYVTSKNKKSFIKRLYRFYDQTFPELINN